MIPRPKTRAGGLFELLVIVGLALALVLGIQAWLIKPYEIPSGSMEPTLDIGQRVLVNRFIYHFEDPSVGDIIVFHPPAGAGGEAVDGGCGSPAPVGQPCATPTRQESGENFVKRLVAGPGDRVKVIHGQAIVNGKVNPAANHAAETDLVRALCGDPLPRSQWASVRPDKPCDLPKPIVVPPDHYFVMGDNRGLSDDSRYWGPIPRGWIIGKAFATYWPPNRLGFF